MGVCTYCGKKSGFLKKEHPECRSNRFNAKYEIIDNVTEAIIQSLDFDNLTNEINVIAEKNYLKQDEIPNLIVEGFDNAIDSFLDDGILTEDEENKINIFLSYYNFEQKIIDKNGSLQRVVKTSILKEILDGKIPNLPKMNDRDNLPFMLQKAESIIWLFENVDYYQQITKTVYEGRTQGVSFKIAKGIYYRTGAFKGRPVRLDEMKHLATGSVALTNKNIYFASALKNLRIPYNKIITIDQYEDGIGLQKDGANTKPQVFKGLDGWFTYNLISNLNQL